MIVYQEHDPVSTPLIPGFYCFGAGSVIARHEGFIVHASYQPTGTGTRIFFIGRLRTGETFAVVEERARPGFYLRASDSAKLTETPGIATGDAVTTDLRAIDGEPVIRMEWAQIAEQQEAARSMAYRGIRTYEADIRFYDQFLIERQVYGPVTIDGEAARGRRVDLVFHNPSLSASDWTPKLSLLSVDIETNPHTGEILSIAVATNDTWRQKRKTAVLFLGAGVTDDTVTCFDDEMEMLSAFRELLIEIDPDIITGWNVIEFDFAVLFGRFNHYRIPFTLGRSDEAGNFLPGSKGQSSAVIIPGRQVVDGMRTVRYGPIRFENNRLETVAVALLGAGKVSFTEDKRLVGDRKIDALLETYRKNPATFCSYNLKDAVLVIDILEQTGLIELTVRRAAFTGVGLARAWTSVASFEQLYITSMRKRKLVAPSSGVDACEVKPSPGGAIIPPQPGLYKNVVLYDFKSLYPSIMLTFNLDPISYLPSLTALKHGELNDLLQAPNGACFRREPAILPEILQNFFEQREAAKKAKDQVASYVYKIIMNSFYGVLGTPGCRFASSDIAGAITSFGHHFLIWCKENLESRGHRVIYGDTDSLFVLLHPGEEATSAASIAADLNYSLGRYIRQNWRVESRLELEHECLYLRFFLPPTRAPSGGGANHGETPQLRGRAKGYAGMRVNVDGNSDPQIDIKGMEAVRRDWTLAARKLQKKLLSMIFEDSSIDDIRDYVCRYIRDLLAGNHDGDLVYRKALRKTVSSYTRSVPPHVRAAMALRPEDREGVIEYVWTKSGPQPAQMLSSPIDYEHYLQKQLKPVTEGISIILNADLNSLFTDSLQSNLF